MKTPYKSLFQESNIISVSSFGKIPYVSLFETKDVFETRKVITKLREEIKKEFAAKKDEWVEYVFTSLQHSFKYNYEKIQEGIEKLSPLPPEWRPNRGDMAFYRLVKSIFKESSGVVALIFTRLNNRVEFEDLKLAEIEKKFKKVSIDTVEAAFEEYLNRLDSKIQKILRTKEIEKFTTKPDHRARGGMGFGSDIHFSFIDGSEFNLQSNIVRAERSPDFQGNVYVPVWFTYPVTFHDIIMPDGTKHKSASEDWMIKEFAGQKDYMDPKAKAKLDKAATDAKKIYYFAFAEKLKEKTPRTIAFYKPILVKNISQIEILEKDKITPERITTSYNGDDSIIRKSSDKTKNSIKIKITYKNGETIEGITLWPQTFDDIVLSKNEGFETIGLPGNFKIKNMMIKITKLPSDLQWEG